MLGSGIYFPFNWFRRFVPAIIACLWMLSGWTPPARAQIIGEVVITNRFANIRSGPGTKYARLGKAYRGERFPVMDIIPQWYQIMYNDRVGWVYSKLVRFEQSMPTQEEIERVSEEISILSKRIDNVLEKLSRANELLSRKLSSGESEAPQGTTGKPDEEVELEKEDRIAREAPVAPAWAFVPGGARLAAGHKLKGWGLLAATLGCLGAGVYYHGEYQDYQDRYRALTSEDPPQEFERLHDKADRQLKLSDSFFYAAAGLYAFNVLDYFLFLPRSPLGIQVETTPSNGQKINLSMSCSF